jgi:quercetin dioxygenase-like cupin family protein
MHTRKRFLQKTSAGLLCSFVLPSIVFGSNEAGFDGLVVNDEQGEAVRMRDGSSIVRIKIAKSQGSESICFLSESFRPGDFLPVHKHLNEDELIFIHKGAGILTLNENEYPVSEGAVIIVPKGRWHGLKNTGTINIEMRMAFTPAGFENFFREVGQAPGQPFVQKTMEQRRAIAKKWGMIYKD